MLELPSKLFSNLKTNSLLFASDIHGLKHWRTVERNGHYLAQFNQADNLVISYFAYFHDCMRQNEHQDPEHGPRGAKYAKKVKKLIGLNTIQLKQLVNACSGHTYGRKTDCITIATCWDADRLDLARVGIVPNSKYLLTTEAKRIADDSDFQVLDQFYRFE